MEMYRCYYLILIIICPRLNLASLVRRNLQLEVRNGRDVIVSESNLQLTQQQWEICKVVVIENEPLYQRVGELTPKIFNCNYLPKSVRYRHNGSPLLQRDVVKLRAHRLLVNETKQETFYLHINIINSQCDVIRAGKQVLVVPEFNAVSNKIDANIVQFHYERRSNLKCEVRINQNIYLFPGSGHLVVPTNSTIGSNSRPFEPSGTIVTGCDEFLLLGVRYQHEVSPTPDIDYIPLHIIIIDKRSGFAVKDERYWLPVKVQGAFPNQNPKRGFSSMYILEVDQFILTNLLPMTVSATDLETPNGRLIFNVSKPPEGGFITHLDDETKEVESFYQKDLQNLKIGYKPPNVSFTERRTFYVEFTAFDSYFASSQPIKVLLSVRVAHTNAPRISWNNGLSMLEGQSRPITPHCLQIEDEDNIDMVRVTLAGGLQHGSLYVNDEPGYSFSWNDIVNGNVVYKHDDTDTTNDFIMFRVADGIHSTRFKIPILILPKDDAPPQLINNVDFEVQEGQTILIHRFMLEAYDQDSSSDFIKFNITKQPSCGEIQKKLERDKYGWRVKRFEQKDLYQGLIYYTHSGEQNFEDSFEFIMIDSCRPYPNISPKQTVNINVMPVDDLPPKAASNITRTLTVNETDAAFLTPEMLLYHDEERPGSDVMYKITASCQRVYSDGTEDPGHLVYADDMVKVTKGSNIPILMTFRQSAVNHSKVGYIPPVNDIGLSPVDVKFEFSVTNLEGTTSIEQQEFTITILPVDDKAPRMQLQELSLKEGSTDFLSTENIVVEDQDTPLHQLKYVIVELPRFGSIENNGSPLQSGDFFTYGELEEFRVLYSHDGSENHQDSFKLLVTDGHQNSTTVTANVNIIPVDDKDPYFTSDSGNPFYIKEGGKRIISSDFLRAIDIDTVEDRIMFEAIDGPHSGRILLNGEISRVLSQRDINSGLVEYQHDGKEIGYKNSTDVVVFITYDDPEGDSPIDEVELEGLMETFELDIVITPVNDKPPIVLLGNDVFSCEEGDRSTIETRYLSADDPDTLHENLAFTITTSPKFGYIEDTTFRPGFEKQLGVRVTSFDMKRLAAGNIHYVQSIHTGIEPTSDQFDVAATDGKYKSKEVPFLITILPINDESPEVRGTNFSCTEGDLHELSDAVFSILDRDIPQDEVMISVISSPKHGMLIDKTYLDRRQLNKRGNFGAGDMHPLHDISLAEWNGHLVQPAYLHDGSESVRDSIEFRISDGKFTKKMDLEISIVLVNDEPPEILTNKGIKLELGETKIISNIFLLSTDADSPDVEIVYVPHSLPTRGKLQMKRGTQWEDLLYGDTFTQEDIESNLIRYHHSNILGTKGRDSFRFSVTDGTYVTRRQNFEIEVKHTQKTMVHVMTNTASVNEGDKIFITTEILTARDGSNRPQDITFTVMNAPMFGRIEFINDPLVSIDHFTQMDILARKVVYVQTSKEDTDADSIIVRVSNGIHSSEGVVTLEIIALDTHLPTLLLFPTADGEQPMQELIVYSGASVTINQNILSIIDPDTAKSHLILNISSLPSHGTLFIGETELEAMEHLVVTQANLENAEFMYKHSGDGAQLDRFSFTVTDGTHEDYLIDGNTVRHPTIFNIRIEHLDETPPEITLNIPTAHIEQFGDEANHQYAVYIDSHFLVASEDQHSSGGEIIFSVTEQPFYGAIKKLEANSKASMISSFSQLDLNKRRVVYIVDSKYNVTNDSFVFDVQDEWGNIVMGHRFSMSWARIEVTEKVMKVCESGKIGQISFRRYGNLTISSFISIKADEISATRDRDFIVESAEQLQFDPDVTAQTWSFKIMNDSLEERKEKFQVILHSPVNAVLAPQHSKTTVSIIDGGINGCARSQNISHSDKTEMVMDIISRKIRKHSRKRYRKSKSKKTKKESGDRKLSNKRKKKTRKRLKGPKTIIGNKPRFGRLGLGVTVPPSSYSKNKTHRIWNYHGLIPITTYGKTGGDTKSTLNEKIVEEATLNDEPAQGSTTESREIPIKPFRRLSVPIPPDIPAPSSPIRIKCSIEMINRLHFDPITGTLNRCNGVEWTKWSLSKSKASDSVARLECDESWHRFENRCYRFHYGDDNGESWNSAQRKCREQDMGQLATVLSRKHMDWFFKRSGRRNLWIGLNKKLNLQEWEWLSGDPVQYANWRRGHPRRRSPQNNLDCAIVSSRKRWIEENCGNLLPNAGYVCMKGL